MLTRDQRSYAVVKQSWSGTDSLVSSKSLGLSQSISALNNTGIFIPGVLRLNPVVIFKSREVGTPATSPSNSRWMLSGMPYSVQGDVAAWLSSQAGIANVIQNQCTWDSSMASYSLGKAFSKASQADFDVGMILVELKETIHGLRHPLSALNKYIRDFNKMRITDPKSIKRTLDMLSGSWLEWRYGITPLIITIESAIKHVQSLKDDLDGKMLRKRGKTNKEYTTPPSAVSAYVFYASLSGYYTLEVKKSTTSSVIFQLTKPLTWQERYGLNILNLPALMWEKLPLSFVGDWFLGVGNWLQSINLSDKRVTIGTSTSQKTEVVCRIPSVSVSVNGVFPQPLSSSYVNTFERLERRINLTPPLLPVVNPADLSLQRTIDAVTLIWQRLPKFRR